MATLERIRGMKYLLIGFVGFALLAFIIGDLFQGISSFQDDPNTMVKVNGEEVTVNEFQPVYERLVENERAQRPDGTITDVRENQIRNQVVNSLIQQKLLNTLIADLGLTVGRKELTDLIVGDHISPMVRQYFTDPQTGMFNKEALDNYVLAMSEGEYNLDEQGWTDLTKQVKEQQVFSKFASLLTSSFAYNSLDRKAEYDNNNLKVDFEYVSKPYASISDDEVMVSDAELRAYYEKEKNRFVNQDETVLLDYISVRLAPSTKDLDAAKGAMDVIKGQMETTDNVSALVSHNSTVAYKGGYRSYNSLTSDERRFVGNNEIGAVSEPTRSGNNFVMHKYESKTVAPDSVTFNILAVQNVFGEEQVKAKADSLMNVINSGTPFGVVSMTETQGRFDGSYGSHTEQSLLDAEGGFFNVDFKNEVFNAPLNKLTLVSNGTNSFIVQVTEKTAPVEKYKVATIRKEVRPSKETRNETYNQLSRYVSSNRDLQAFRDSASVAGYNIYSDYEVTKESTSLANIEDTRQIVQWAFNHKKGEISRIYETRNSDYLIVAAIQDIHPAGPQALASVEDVLKRELMNEKKAEKIISDLKAKNLSSLDQYAEAMQATSQTVRDVSFGMEYPIVSIESEPVIYAKAPLAEVGQIAGPYQGTNAVYVLYVTDKRVSEEAYDDETQKQKMNSSAMMKTQQFMNNPMLLESNAKIVNNSINFPIYR